MKYTNRLTEDKVKAIAADVSKGFSDHRVSVAHQVHPETVRKLRQGKTHTKITGFKPGQFARRGNNLSTKDAAEIKYWLAKKMPQRKIAEAYGVTTKAIWKIANGEAYAKVEPRKTKPTLPTNRVRIKRQPRPRVPYSRCPECELVVQMPCLACRAKEGEPGAFSELPEGPGPLPDDPSPERIKRMCKQFLKEAPRLPVCGHGVEDYQIHMFRHNSRMVYQPGEVS